MLEPEFRDHPQQLRSFGYLFYRIQFFEALSLCLCIMILLTLSRHYKPMSHITNELLGAVPQLLLGTVIWLFSQVGLCIWNISLYGGSDPRYANFLIAYVHTLYAQAALGLQDEEHLSLSAFFFRVVNNIFLYILYIILGGIIVANLKGEYTLELLTVEEQEDTSNVKGKRR